MNEGCKKCHRLLPDKMVPYRHYEAALIEAVLDGVTGEEDDALADGPSPITIRRWREWGQQHAVEAEGKLRSAAHRILDLTDEFLGSGSSLLAALRERLVEGWLPVTLRVIWNTGG